MIIQFYFFGSIHQPPFKNIKPPNYWRFDNTMPIFMLQNQMVGSSLCGKWTLKPCEGISHHRVVGAR